MNNYIQFTSIKELGNVGKRYNVKIKVNKIYKNIHPKKIQEGIAADHSGEIKFIIWANSNLIGLKFNHTYILNNVKFTIFNNKRQLQIDKYSHIIPYHKKNSNDNTTDRIDFKREKQKIEEERKKLLLKEQAFKKHKIFTIIKYFFYFIVIIAGGIYIYNYLSAPSPIVDDIIIVKLGEKSVPFKITKIDKKTKKLKLTSLDKYKENIELDKSVRLEKAKVKNKSNLKNNIFLFEKNKISYVTSDINNVVIHINTEDNDEILKKLPGIGDARVRQLKRKRPFHNLKEVINAKIGIGKYWAEEWKKGIKLGLIKFD